MQLLPVQTLPAVPHIVFGIFNLAIPNLIALLVVTAIVPLAAWARLPKFLGAPD